MIGNQRFETRLVVLDGIAEKLGMLAMLKGVIGIGFLKLLVDVRRPAASHWLQYVLGIDDGSYAFCLPS